MYARSTTIHADPQRIDAGIAHVRDEVMPAVQSMPGCIGLSMLCDRDTGRCIVTASWDSEEAMRATADSVHQMRQRAATAARPAAAATAARRRPRRGSFPPARRGDDGCP